MKILVTGAGGLIGRAIVADLTKAGHHVTLTDRPGVDLAYVQAPSDAFDLRDADRLTRTVQGHHAIVHSAGLFDLGASREALRAANVEAVASVVEAGRRAGVKRLIHLSTVGVYGRPRVIPCPESEPPRPRQDYERTKAEGEAIARAATRDLGVSILRPTIVYGPFSRYGFCVFIGRLYLTLSQGRRDVRLPKGSPMMHAVHVEDVARAVSFCVAHPETAGESYNLADDAPAPAMHVMGALARELGVEPRFDIGYVPWVWRLLVWTAAHVYTDGRLRRMNTRIERRWTRLAAELGFAPAFVPKFDRDWFGYLRNDHVYDNRRLKALGFSYLHPDVLKGLTATLRWYRENNWLPAPDRVLAWGRARKAPEALATKSAHAPR